MSDKIIVTIARQYGSGGHAVGELVANNFNMAYHDKSLIEKSAQKMGVSAEMLQSADEKATPSFLYSIATGNYDVYPLSINFAPYEMPINDKLFNLQADIIREESEKSSCVFVGRCADYILNGNPKLVKVFIYADMDSRVKRVMEHHGISEQDARVLIYKTDKKRANYYNYYTGHDWGDMRRYDLTIHSGRSGIEGAVELIESLVHLRGGVR